MKAEAALIEIARRNGMIITSSDALHLVGRECWDRAQEQGLWIQVAPDRFRHAATALTFEMQVRAGAGWLSARGALYGSTALRWLGIDVPEPSSAEFLVRRDRRAIPNWVQVHTTVKWDNGDVIRHNGVRTSTATRAVIDFAAQGASARSLEQAIDEAIRLRRTALARLKQRLAGLSGRGHHGCALLREILLDSGGESHLERRFLRLLRSHDLPRPECQVVFRKDGQTVARVDFMFPAAAVIVEVTGRLGHTSDRDRQRDARRRNHLQDLGNDVIEFTTTDVIDDPAYVLSTLKSSLKVLR
ncbi:MAG: DUF559 domain-containing protein [Actinomycetota bacterium]|nr:DUF559 domain-containing protein [Actinomycetota bacterium]